MFNNKLEKIIWEEISKIIEEKGILLEKSPGRLVHISKIGYQTFRNTLNRLSSVGRAALNKGEKDFLDTFLFPRHPRPRLASDQRRAAVIARAQSKSRHSPVARSARHSSGAGPDDVRGIDRAFSTESWGAEAFERAYVNSVAKSARNLRSGLGTRGGLKNTSLKNKRADGKGLSKSEINDGVDDAIQEALEHALKDLSTIPRRNLSLNRGIPREYLAKASRTFRRKLSEKVDTDDLLQKMGKKGGQARKDLEKIYKKPIEKLKVKAQVQKQQAKRMGDAVKKQEDSLEALRNQKKMAGGETSSIDKKIRTAERTLAKRKKELELRNNQIKKTESNIAKKEAELENINNLNDRRAGEEWLQKQIEKAADDADDAVMNGLNNFTSRTAAVKRSRIGSGQVGPKAKVGPKKPVSNKTAEQFMNNQSATFKELLADKVDPSILGRSVDFVKSMTKQNILRLREKILASDNPALAIAGTIAGTGLSVAGIVIALMGDSEDVNGQKVPPPTPEQLRDTAEKLDSLDSSLDTVNSKIDKAPNAAAQGGPAKTSASAAPKMVFDKECEKWITKINSKDANKRFFGADLSIDQWSLEEGSVKLPEKLKAQLEMINNTEEGSSIITYEMFGTALKKYAEQLQAEKK